ncbi:transposase [bacterium]|nr:transposase [bacterium]
MQDDSRERKVVRLPYWNYAGSGYYFLTICCDARRRLLGRLEAGAVELSPIGRIALEELQRSFEIRSGWRLDSSVLMPNHLHCIVAIDKAAAQQQLGYSRQPGHREARSVSSFVSGFKSAVTSRARKLQGNPELKLWHRGFHEHVVRSEESLLALRQYQIDNPRAWELDRYNPGRNVSGPPDPLDAILAADVEIAG